MAGLDVIALAAGMNYTDEEVAGGGAIKGKNCTVYQTEEVEQGIKVTFKWYLDNGTEKTTSIIVPKGADGATGATGADGKSAYECAVEEGYSGTEEEWLASLKGKDGTVSFDELTPEQKAELKGDDGVSPTVTVTEITGGHQVSITDAEGTENFNVMDGEDGQDGKDGLGVPEGGTTGQVLAKKSNTDNDTEWVDAANGSLSDDLTAAISVGGIDSGKSYTAGTPFETLFRDMLEPTLYPSFTSPSASLSYGANTYYAVGASVAAITATLSLNRGTINPAYGTSGYRAGQATGYAISTSGADTEYSDSGDSGSFNVSALTRATKGTIVVTGTVSYAEGEQPKDSKGNDYNSPLAAGSVSATKTLNFILPYYYGKSASSTISDFTGLIESVTAKGNKTFNFTTDNEYMVFAYDSAYGNLKSILDGNGFETISGWTKNTVTVGGFSYYVYVANSPTTDTNAPFTFKY